eukprot:1193292-Prorocentrum_minimum.AAC.3
MHIRGTDANNNSTHHLSMFGGRTGSPGPARRWRSAGPWRTESSPPGRAAPQDPPTTFGTTGSGTCRLRTARVGPRQPSIVRAGGEATRAIRATRADANEKENDPLGAAQVATDSSGKLTNYASEWGQGTG